MISEATQQNKKEFLPFNLYWINVIPAMNRERERERVPSHVKRLVMKFRGSKPTSVVCLSLLLPQPSFFVESSEFTKSEVAVHCISIKSSTHFLFSFWSFFLIIIIILKFETVLLLFCTNCLGKRNIICLCFVFVFLFF